MWFLHGGWDGSNTSNDYSGYLLLCSKGYCEHVDAPFYGGGTLYARGSSPLPYWINCDDNCYSINTSNASDYRLKENLCCWSTICCTTNVVKNIPVYSYNWNEYGIAHNVLDTTSTPRIGFLAHEVEEVVNANRITVGEKDALNAGGNILAQTIDHSAMVPILWSALQETIKKVEALEAEVETLKNS